MDRVEALVKVGGARWTKNGMDRIYFNDLVGWLGLETERYNTGNISSAKMDGVRISNSEARRMLYALDGAKVWFDVTAGKFQGRAIEQIDFDTIVAEIEKKAKELTAE